MKRTQFSVIITCHNQVEFIADAIESALAQTYANREVIVVDDASSDGSQEVLRKYAARVRFIRLERNLGASGARNAGAFIAEGNYLAFLDGDDVLKPWALTIYERIIRAYDPRLIMATLTWFQGAAPAEAEIEVPREIEMVNYDNLVQKDRSYRSSASALVIDRSAFENVAGWAIEACPFEDQHLEAKLAFSGRAITVLSPKTVFYRLHKRNTIHDVKKIIAGCYGFVSARLPRVRSKKFGAVFARNAIIGGPAFWAVKKAFRAKLYADGTKLLVRVSPWVMAAVVVRLRAMIAGRRPTERLVV
jgi:glycosyltransferase involved in cell wall biosynthesis